MRTILFIFFFIISLLNSIKYSQDTISILFDIGSANISQTELLKLENIPYKYNLTELDSICFIGMTDSIGSIKSNQKLSYKRANNCHKRCEIFLSKNTSTSIKAVGESIGQTKNNRRVDIILFYLPKLPQKNQQKIDSVINKCITIDYNLLHNCNIITITKRRKQYVILETEFNQIENKKEHFYGFRTNNGSFNTKKVEWKIKKTGKFWWKKPRIIASIPKNNFDRYKIFKMSSSPCSDCNVNYYENETIKNEDSCLQVENFVMHNLQYKNRIIKPNIVKIRVPKEYIDTSKTYYIGCKKDIIIWKTKKRRKNKLYYYTKLPATSNYLYNITSMMNCCSSKPEPSKCNIPKITCQTLSPPDNSFKLNFETGSHYQNSELLPYLTVNLTKESINNRLNIQTGMDLNTDFYGAINFQHHFISFPYSILSPVKRWSNFKSKPILYNYGRLYVGTELKSTNIHFIEQNIHLGFAAVNTNDDARISRIFIQTGIGYDYIKNYQSGIYSVTQIGINLKLYDF